jgi:hypothetical protein
VGRVRVAALYDIHGNLPALQAVLAGIDLLRVDTVVVGGDVATGPMPVETLEALRERESYFVRGNADRVLDLGDADDGEPGAYWALIDADVELRRTEYDLGPPSHRSRRPGIRARPPSCRTSTPISNDRIG